MKLNGILPISIYLLLTLNLAVFAQDLDEASAVGTVSDSSGAVVPGATVIARRETATGARTAVSGPDGRFRLIELVPGLYEITASAAGFAEKKLTGLTVRAGSSLRIDLTLEPGTVVETVLVDTSDAEADITTSVIGSSVSGAEIARFPNPDGDVLDLVFILAGTAEEPFSTDLLAEEDRIGNGSERDRPTEVTGAGSISLSGGPAYSTNITIDGMDNNDDRLAAERFQPPPEAVEEVQVVASQYSAEYGRASGGRINIRTRSGSRKFGARFSAGFEDESLNANTFNNNRRGLGRLPYTRLDPAVTFFGPVPFSNGKTSFISSAMFQARFASSLIDTVVPTDLNPLYPLPPPTSPLEARVDSIPNPATDGFPAVEIAPYRKAVSTPGTRLRLVNRIDHSISDSHSVTFNLQTGRSRDRRQYRETTRYLEETLQSTGRDTDSFYLSDTISVGSSHINQLKFQFSRFEPGFSTDRPHEPVVLLFVSDDGRAGSPDRVRGTVVIGNSTANFAGLRSEMRYQMQDTLSVSAGRHILRFGADAQVIRSEITELADASGTFNFSRVYDFLTSQPSRYRRSFGTSSLQKNTYSGVFVQDDLTVAEGLNLDLGLRYERESILPDDNNFGPRIAAAWSPWKSGKTVIRFGGGIFYNRVLLRTLDDYDLGKKKVRFDSELLSGPSVESRCLNRLVPGPNALTDKCRFLYALGRIFPSPPDRARLESILAELGIGSGGFATDTNFSRFVGKGIRIPESYQMSAGIERDLGGGFHLHAAFDFNKASSLWRETNVNAFRPPKGFETLTDFLISLGTVEVNGTLTRFVLGTRPDPGGVAVIGGIRTVDLRSSNPSEAAGAPIGIAFAALGQHLGRPFDPSLGQVEMVSSIGRGVYEGLTVSITSARRTFPGGVRGSFRAVYTLSRSRDDGFVDTSSAQTPGDFRSEFGRGSLDRRHRLRFSGSFTLPPAFGNLQFSPVLRFESGGPFNIGIGGSDRNLDDVSNDRPNFFGDASMLRVRSDKDPFPQKKLLDFALAPIGTPGNLPRNAGRGPALFTMDAAVSRSFKFGRVRVEPHLTAVNLLNLTVFSFGSDFIDLSGQSGSEFARGFLVPSRTLGQRKLRAALRFEL